MSFIAPKEIMRLCLGLKGPPAEESVEDLIEFMPDGNLGVIGGLILDSEVAVVVTSAGAAGSMAWDFRPEKRMLTGTDELI